MPVVVAVRVIEHDHQRHAQILLAVEGAVVHPVGAAVKIYVTIRYVALCWYATVEGAVRQAAALRKIVAAAEFHDAALVAHAFPEEETRHREPLSADLEFGLPAEAHSSGGLGADDYGLVGCRACLPVQFYIGIGAVLYNYGVAWSSLQDGFRRFFNAYGPGAGHQAEGQCDCSINLSYHLFPLSFLIASIWELKLNSLPSLAERILLF